MSEVVGLSLEQVVKVKEVEEGVGSSYQCMTRLLNIPSGTPGDITTDTFSFPIPVSILSGETKVKAANDGDEMGFDVGPDTITGTITADVAIGATVIDVAQTVIDNAKVGYFFKLSDGVNTDDLGRVLSIDEDNLQVTVETATEHAFLAATPTYVKQTVKFILNLDLVDDWRLVVGESKIGASTLPANTPLKLWYKNNDGAAKKFAVLIEYLY